MHLLSGRLRGTRLAVSLLVWATLLAAAPERASAAAATLRLAGEDRFATAATIARATFTSAPAAVLVSGDAPADALTVAALAGRLSGPVLLTGRDRLPNSTLDAIRALDVREVVVVGGAAVVGVEPRRQLEQLGIRLRGLAGVDRFATAAEVSLSLGDAAAPLGEPTAFIANGFTLVDALAAAPLSYVTGAPTLLTRADAMPQRTVDAIRAARVRRVVIVGGAAAVGESVRAQLAAMNVTVERVAGANRAETAAALADFARTRLGWVVEGVVIANGERPIDALGASPFAGRRRMPVLLALDAGTLGAPARIWLTARGAEIATVFGAGGPVALREIVLADASAYGAGRPGAGSSPDPSAGTRSGPSGGAGDGAPSGGGGGSGTTTTTVQTLSTVPGTPPTTIAPPGPRQACPQATAPVPVAAATPGLVPALELPLLHRETARGGALVAPMPGRFVVEPKAIDGAIADWVAPATGYAGSTRLACGELVYTDHLFDAYGADKGDDVRRLQRLDPLQQNVPETYRLEPIFQAFGGTLPVEPADQPPVFEKANETYGDLDDADSDTEPDLLDVADLTELRVSADGGELKVLARTTTMTDTRRAALLLLFDTAPGGARRAVGFGSNLSTDAGEFAALVSGSSVQLRDLVAGTTRAVGTAVTNAADFTNAIEATIPLAALGGPSQVRLAAATGQDAGGALADLWPAGSAGPDLPNVANVAFRSIEGGPAEPVRTWFDKRQALELNAGRIDAFLRLIDLDQLRAGTTERWSPGPGYHERIFSSRLSAAQGLAEGGQEGALQHYGVYIPRSYGPLTKASKSTLWLHWRGGKTHSAGAVAPRIFRDQGEAVNRVVIAPRGRGSTEWWVGKGWFDLEEVRADAFSALLLDPDNMVVSGHSMGGFGSYLTAVLRPDWFAASFPVAGTVTQGAWTGIEQWPWVQAGMSPPPGSPFGRNCDEDNFREGSNNYTFCYIDANRGDARLQHTRRMLDNLYNVPIAIFQGAIDELVPTSGVTRQVEYLAQRQYRHRYYLFPTYEHYSHPVIDEWAEGARYVDQFRNPRNPRRVVYKRDMDFECTVEHGPNVRVGTSEGPSVCRRENDAIRPPERFGFDFDRAYWMSRLTPRDPLHGVATIDATSSAITEQPFAAVPEAGGPAAPNQAGPYVMTGLGWIANPAASSAPAANALSATLAGASQVQLDLVRMSISLARSITATITVDGPATVELAAPWARLPTVTAGGVAVAGVTLADGVLRIPLAAAGTHALTITP